tara:strand:+ start:105 stop:431 length:327 start_codon:yes stop_codon:yes gene_type:complete
MINENSPKVKLIIGLSITALMLITAIGFSYADSKKWIHDSSCPYDNVTGNYVDSYGNEYAYGTMETAHKCAFLGLLPKIVQDRLGSLGDKQTQKDTELILKLNANSRK